jgi:hypothetical protein
VNEWKQLKWRTFKMKVRFYFSNVFPEKSRYQLINSRKDRNRSGSLSMRSRGEG